MSSAEKVQIEISEINVSNAELEARLKARLEVYFEEQRCELGGGEVTVTNLDDGKTMITIEGITQENMLHSLKHDHSWLGDSVVLTECKVSKGAVPSHVSSTSFAIDISKSLVNCLKKNTEELNKQLSHLHAAISINTETKQIIVNPCLGSEKLEDWEVNCRSVIDSYLKKFITETFLFTGETKETVITVIHNIIQSQPSLHIEYDAETVVITGLKVIVDKTKERLKKAQDSQMINKESVLINDQKFLSFLQVRLDTLLENHPEVEATLQADENCISILGIKDSCIAFKADLESLRTSMTFVEVMISKDLIEFLSGPLGRTLLHQYLKDFESLVAIYFEPDGMLCLLCSRKDDGIKVAKIIQQNLSSVFIIYPEIFISSLKSKQWATLKADLEESCYVSINIVENKIKLIGDKGSLDHVSKDIQQFIDREFHVEKSIPLCEAQWRLLTSHMSSKWSKVEQNLKDQRALQLSFPDGEDPKYSITLKGENSVVAECAKQIEDLLSTICTNSVEQARPGIAKFFYSDKGKTFITGVEAQEKSCIQLDALQDVNGDSYDLIENGISKFSSDKLLGMGKTKEGKIITLVKGDITEIPVDVIVNASNTDLKHTGGVALAIANKGGSIIQEESNRYIRIEGKLSDGDAIMMKEVGELPCKRLIHAVGPKWNGGLSNEETLLYKACMEALKLASNFKTISFPAICSGVFSFPINKCATCMIRTFMEYSTNHAVSTLDEITIVVCDQYAIDAFISEMNKCLNDFHSTSYSGVSGVTDDIKPVHNKHKKYNANLAFKEDPGIIAQFIKLYKGELLKQSADVYVNTANGNLNLNLGAVAASFLKAGGRGLQDECTAYVKKNGMVPCGEVIVTKPGAIQCTRIIHAVGPVYSGIASEKILQDLVQKCLRTCDELRASTIAFPALGAGNLKYPQNVVADIMVNTIADYLKANYSTTCIKTVKLVIFMDSTYAEFDRLLTSKLSVAGPSLVQDIAKPLSQSSAVHSSVAEVFKAGNVRVEILQGDITEDDSDAIVNTTNEKMQLVGSGVAGAILRKGGPEMQKSCDTLVSQGIQLQEGKVCVTPSTGNLKCSKVFHIVIPKRRKQMLARTVTECLKRAEKLKLNSITFPAVGTGNLGYSLEEAAHGICSSIIAFGEKTNPIHVNRVRIIIFQKEMCQAFKNKFTEITNKSGILKRVGATVMSLFLSNSSLAVAEQPLMGSKPFIVPQSLTSVFKITEKSILLMHIYAEDEEKVAKTIDRLHRIIEDQFTNEEVSDVLLSKLSQKQKDDLTRKAKQKHVQIIIETGADFNYIQLKGDRTDVADLKSDIQEHLRQITCVEAIKREAKLLQAKVKWQWLNGNNNYEDYDDLPNYYIEKAYQCDKTKQFNYKPEGGILQILNFSRMEAKDTHDQKTFKIKRVDIEDLLKEVESPGKWDPMPRGVLCHVVSLIHNTDEYSEVKSKFKKTMKKQRSLLGKVATTNVGEYKKIIKIERIQNSLLHAQYVAKKKIMDQHNPPNVMNERDLFHGCPGDVVNKISHHGFNRSFAGRNATLFGKGVYFAHDAKYAANDRYSPRDTNNRKYMFLVKVLTGEFTVGSPDYVTPPPRAENSLTLFDCVVNNTSNPSIFVIFADAQAYPDYLITFT